MKKRLTKLKWIGVTLASLGALASSNSAMAHARAHKEGMRAESDGGLVIYSPSDSSYWFQLGGRLAFDETLFKGKSTARNGFPSGGNIRYARLKFAGGVGDYLSYNLTLNLNGSNDPRGTNGTRIDFEDAWLAACSEYSGPIDKANIRFGQFTPPTSIDELGNYGTDNDTFFLESSLASRTFSNPKKALGAWVDVSALDTFVLSVSAHHPRQNNTETGNNRASANNYQNPSRSDRLGGAARLTFAPVHTETMVYHLGALGRYQSMNSTNVGGGPVSQVELFSAAPEARARNTARMVNTGDIRAKSYNVVSGEALGMWGPAWVEGEYHHTNVQRVPTATNPLSTGNPKFHSWHIQGGYVLTGESRVYDYMSGALRNPKPADKAGAWEILARFSYVNLVNRNIYGGSEHNTTIGLNWFVNQNLRIAANFIRAHMRQAVGTEGNSAPTPVSLAKRQLNIFGLRVGVEF